MRKLLIIVALVGLVACEVPKTVTQGETVVGFNHDGVSTDRYELHVMNKAVVRDLEVTAAAGTTKEFVFPDLGLPEGNYATFIRAVGPGGETDGPVVVLQILEASR